MRTAAPRPRGAGAAVAGVTDKAHLPSGLQHHPHLETTSKSQTNPTSTRGSPVRCSEDYAAFRSTVMTTIRFVLCRSEWLRLSFLTRWLLEGDYSGNWALAAAR